MIAVGEKTAKTKLGATAGFRQATSAPADSVMNLQHSRSFHCNWFTALPFYGTHSLVSLRPIHAAPYG